jgi:hypothetical protein
MASMQRQLEFFLYSYISGVLLYKIRKKVQLGQIRRMPYST